MKKAYRVKSDADFQKVFHTGRSTANRQFVVYVLEKPEQTHFRVGVSVGKKLGNAVIRNRVKRKIRQAVFEINQEKEITHNKDFIIIARKPTLNMTLTEYKKSLIHVFKLAKLI